MKVLQVINSLATGGAEKLLLDTIPKYIEKGIEMDILVLNGTEYPFYNELKNNPNFQLISLGKLSVYNPFLILKIIKYLKNYDFIHVHLFPSLYWVSLAKLISFSKVKLIYTEHSTNNRRMNNWFLKIIDRFVYSKYNKIICITNEVENQIKNQLHFSNDKFIVIQNGIDLSKIEIATNYSIKELNLNLPNDVKLLLQVSSFQFPKDQSTVIRSLLYLPQDVHLLLVGQGVLLEQNKQLVNELQLSDRVHFLGVRMDVARLLKTCDILILSSQYEGLSLSSMEALASGKPFVASNVPGLKEIVSDAGILFPFQDDGKLAEICNELITNKNKYDTIVVNCLLKSKQYDINIMIQKHINLYQSLLG